MFTKKATRRVLLRPTFSSCPNSFLLGTRIGSLESKIGSLESEKFIIGSLESEKSGPYRSLPGTLHFP